jgi:prepilin-type N-terminal cleavage/methylation domain-containing protein
MTRTQQGLTLVEMAVALAVFGALAVGVLGITSLTSERNRFNESAESLDRLERALIAYVETNWRLPCPDISGTETNPGNGVESCASPATQGQIPFRTLGLSEPPLDPWRRPFVYAVDRRLTTVAPAQQYRYEFCQRLRINSGDFQVSQLHTLPESLSGTQRNLAYVMLTGGGRDLSGNGSRIDQLVPVGATRALRVDDQQPGSISDDRYLASSLFVLSGRLRCGGALVSVNATENEIIAARLSHRNIQLSVDNAQSNIDGVSRQITSGALQIVNATAGVAAAAATAINAVGQGLVGNGAALASFGGAVVGAAAAVSSLVSAAIAIDGARASKAAMEARLSLLSTYTNDIERLCAGAETAVTAAKHNVSACP